MVHYSIRFLFSYLIIFIKLCHLHYSIRFLFSFLIIYIKISHLPGSEEMAVYLIVYTCIATYIFKIKSVLINVSFFYRQLTAI